MKQVERMLKKELEKFLKDYKRMPSRKELLSRIRKIRRMLDEKLLSVSRKSFEIVYVTSALKVTRELGEKLVLSGVDENALNVLLNKPVLRQSFVGLSREVSNKFQEVFEKNYSLPYGLSRKKIQEEIIKVSDVARGRAELIARTESAKVSSAARRVQYMKSPDFNNFLFKHVGPNDARTTDLSKRIKRRVGKGVLWDDYVRIVMEESVKDFPEWVVDPSAPVSHYNSRHSFLCVGTLPE